MTVKDVKRKIEVLQRNYDNLIRLQEFFLGYLDKKEDRETVLAIMSSIHLSMPVRDLCSSTASILSEEIKRLEEVIDNTVVIM